MLTVLFAFQACSSDSSENKIHTPRLAPEEIPSLTDKELTILITDSGRLTAKLFAPSMAHFDKAKKPYKDLIGGLTVENYGKDGQVESQISSEYAIYWERDELWELSNKVKAINAEGVIYETERLLWDTKKKIVFSDEQIKITDGDEVIVGDGGFEANEDFSWYELKRTNANFIISDE